MTPTVVVFDCDSTLIQEEVIELLAAYAGTEREVAEVTSRAMHGDLDFAESLRQRVATLAGLDASILREVRPTPTPGVPETLEACRRAGCTTAVVSGGFTQVLDPLAERLGIDHALANNLEVRDGKLTGAIDGPIVDRAAKAAFLESLGGRSVAIGDGANDIDMLRAADTGVAFNAKPALWPAANVWVNSERMDAVLPLIGL